MKTLNSGILNGPVASDSKNTIARKLYTKPTLAHYGNLAGLTLATGNQPTDGVIGSGPGGIALPRLPGYGE